MKRYCFEIVRRGVGRYAWRLVVLKDERRRVVARSVRDYRSPKRVRRAIRRLQSADIVDRSDIPDGDPFPLPATAFRLLPGVVPLWVDATPSEYETPELEPAAVAMAAGRSGRSRPSSRSRSRSRKRSSNGS